MASSQAQPSPPLAAEAIAASRRAAFKLFLALYLPLALVLSGIIYGILKIEGSLQMATLGAHESEQVKVAGNALNSYFKASDSDLMILAHAPAVKRFLESGSRADKEQVAELFSVMSQEKQIYEKIRYFDADGMEVVRVNMINGKAEVTPEKELQNKRGRYFFKDSFRLSAGEVYVSPLDLNVENNQLEIPYRPMLRFGTPVFNRAGEKKGVVLINVSGKELLEDFRRNIGGDHYAMLINREGYWLSHINPALVWGFMFGNDLSFAKYYPSEWKIISSHREGSFSTPNGLFTYSTDYPLLAKQRSSTGSALPGGSSAGELAKQEYYWKVVSLVPFGERPSDEFARHRLTFTVYGMALALLAILVWYLAVTMASRGQWRQAVFENEMRLREITAHLGEGLYVSDEHGIITFINPEAAQLLGWAEKELVGKDEHNIFHRMTPDGISIPTTACPVHQAIITGQAHRAFNDWFVRKDGTFVPVSVTASPIIRNGEIAGAVAAFRDITQRLDAEKVLRESEERFRSAMNHAPIGMAIVSLEGRFMQVNHALCDIVGYEAEELARLTYNDITHPDDLEAGPANAQRLLNGEIGFLQIEKRYIHKDGQIVWVQVTTSAIGDSLGKPLYFISQIENITERKRAQKEISLLAYYDTLTGLPNRRLLLDRLNQSIAKARRYQRSVAVMFMDLDKFKKINDTLGHDIGDELLKVVAARLNACVRSEDTVSRQGGDEFIVLTEINIPQDAALVAEKILKAMSEPVSVSGHAMHVTASIGIAIFPANAENAQELMKKADSAMYSAKKAGRNRYLFYQA